MARTKAPKDETPEAKFVRLGSSRVQNAIDAMERVAKLSGPGYKSTAAQREKIVNALQQGVNLVKESLETGKSQSSGFQL